MENETKPVETVTTEPLAPEVQTNEVVEPVDQPKEPSIDYAMEYEKEKERREKAEFALYKKKKAERAAKQTQEADSGVVDTDEIKKQVEDTFYAMNEAQREKDAEDVIDEELMRLTSNPDELKLIRFKYDNAINKTGFSRLAIRQDLDDAKFLANKSRYLKEKSELAQSAISKQTITNSGGGTNLDRPVHTDDLSKQFSKQDWEFMQKRKFTPEQIKAVAQENKFK